MSSHLKTLLPQVWLTKGWFSNVLLPLTWLYLAVLGMRRALYRSGVFKTEKVHAIVIVIGNAVAGGGGKTPLTMAVVDHLKRAGHRVGVISRGYGRQTRDVREVTGNDDALKVGDEPLMIQERCDVPVFVALKRVEAARALLAAHPQTDILVCDDGLQHYALARDIEICALDARGLGNGRLLPAGPLREPWPRKVDLLIHTGQRTLTEGFSSSRSLSDEAMDSLGKRTRLASLKNQPVNAVAGIAQPQAFFHMLQAQSLQLMHTWALPDHDSFQNWAPPVDGHPLLCTEKDAVKLWPRYPHALAVRLNFEPESSFWSALDQQIQSKTHA